MEKRVRLTLTGRQRDDLGQENVTELSAEAEYFERNGSHYIIYEEKQADGEITKNTIKLKNGLLELTKKGAVNARMVFEPGQEHMTDYATPYGLLRLGVATTGVFIEQSEKTLEIRADYSLTDNGRILSRCTIFIKIQDLV